MAAIAPTHIGVPLSLLAEVAAPEAVATNGIAISRNAAASLGVLFLKNERMCDNL